MFGEHHRRAAVADRELRNLRCLPETGAEPVLERTVLHPINQVGGARPVGELIGSGGGGGAGGERGGKGGVCQDTHRSLLSVCG